MIGGFPVGQMYILTSTHYPHERYPKMNSYHMRSYGRDFSERDALLRPLHNNLSLAKLQRNKLLVSQIEKDIKRIHRAYWF